MANGQKKKKKRKNWPFVLIFLLGAALVGYPIFTQWYYRIEAQKVVEHFDKAVGRLDPEEIERRMALAYAYNDALLNISKRKVWQNMRGCWK